MRGVAASTFAVCLSLPLPLERILRSFSRLDFRSCVMKIPDTGTHRRPTVGYTREDGTHTGLHAHTHTQSAEKQRAKEKTDQHTSLDMGERRWCGSLVVTKSAGERRRGTNDGNGCRSVENHARTPTGDAARPRSLRSSERWGGEETKTEVDLTADSPPPRQQQ